MSYRTDISVKIKGAEFKNPVMPASGAYDYFDCNANLFSMSELGAVMVKSVHREVRPGNPGPRITEVLGGMINAVGIPSRGIEHFMEHDIDKYKTLGAPVVLSLSGSRVEHYIESLRIVANDKRITAVELNLSCPNVGNGLPFSSDTEVLRDLVMAARGNTELPMFVKLTPNVTDIRESAKTAEESGADAITVSNTFRAMKIDIKKQKPVLGNISGGMSGPAIKPLNMFLVWQAYTSVSIPIIASGGVACWQDAVEYILAGASMVQVGCSNFANPLCMTEVIDGIDKYAYEHGYKSLSEMRGIAHR
ncbi:MAG: dihydroorotate dehydrogenase [Christensenellales bacterium]